MADNRLGIEKLKKLLSNKTNKEKIEAIKSYLDTYYDNEDKLGQQIWQAYHFDFEKDALKLKEEIENDNAIAYERDWNWFYNTDNIGNNDAVITTRDFIETIRKEEFESLYFFNLLFKQVDDIKDNLDTPIDFINHLKSLPINEMQKHTIFGMLLFWHGGYPVNNLNPKYNTILKLIEREFLLMFPNTITFEKEFCRANKEFKTQLKDLENKFNNNPLLLSGGKFHEIEFNFEDLPSWIISKGIQQRYSQVVLKNENDYTLWINDLKQFVETVPDTLKIKTIKKGIEYGEMIYNFHLQKECSNPNDCPYDQSWIRRITLAKTLFAELKPLPIQKAITTKSKLDFTKDNLEQTVLQLARLNGYDKPSVFLDELLEDVSSFDDFDFECNFFLNIHYLCKENADQFWSESHRKDISQWLMKSRIVTDVFNTTWDASPKKGEVENEKSQLETKPGKVKISIPAYAIMHVYLSMFNGQAITQQNKKELAKKYGYNSGDQLRNEFTKYQNEDKRLDLSINNKKSANTHLERFKSVLPLLKDENSNAYNKAREDLQKLEYLYNKHY